MKIIVIYSDKRFISWRFLENDKIVQFFTVSLENITAIKYKIGLGELIVYRNDGDCKFIFFDDFDAIEWKGHLFTNDILSINFIYKELKEIFNKHHEKYINNHTC